MPKHTAKKRIAAASALVTLALTGSLLTACTGGGGDAPTAAEGPQGTLRVNWGGFPGSWAPGYPMEPGYVRVPYEMLTRLGEGNEVEPWLATEWTQTDADITISLRDDVTFQDGTPFDAAAVKTNIEYVRDNPGQFSGPLKVVSSIDVVDDHTLKVNLSRPAPSFMTMLSQRNVPMASPAAIADGSIVTHPVGTGPWAYDPAQSIDGTKMTFTLYDGYWGELPGYANIELYGIADDTAATAALLSGEIDITDTEEEQLPTLESAADADYLEYPAIRNNVVFIDRGPGGAFESVDLRKAVCTALNPQTVVDMDMGVSQFAQQHFVEGEIGYNASIVGYPFSLDAAKKLYAKAGSPTVTTAFPAAAFVKSQLEAFADQINQLPGMSISVQELPTAQFVSEWNSGKYAIALGNNTQLTPYDWYATFFAQAAGANPAHVESDALKAAAQAAVQAGATDAADALWEKVMKIIIDDEALACGFMIGRELVAWNTGKVSGVTAPDQPWENNLVNYRDLVPVG